jgi:two-component system NtrC family sensor kinase
MTLRDIFITSGLYSFLTTVLLGLFVLLYDRKNPLNIFYGIFALTVGGWSIGSSLENLIKDETTALWALRGCYLYAVILPSVFIHFTHIVTGVAQVNRKSLIASYCISLLLIPFVFTDFFIEGFAVIEPYEFRITKPGPVYYVFLVFFSIVCARILILMYAAANKTSGIQRKQLQYFFIAHAIAIMAGIDYFSRVLQIVHFPPIDDYLLVIYFLVFAYAIAKYRLMDITVVVSKSVAYAVVISLIFISASLFAVLSQRATFYALPPLVSATLSFALGLWVVLKDHRSPKHITFTLICLAISAWLFSAFMTYSAHSLAEAFFWGRLAHVGIVLLPAFFYHFVATLLPRHDDRPLIISHYVLSSLFLLLIPNPSLLNVPQSFFWGYYPTAGPLYTPFLIYFGVSTVLSLTKLYRGYKLKEGTAPLDAARLKHICAAFMVGYVSAIDFVQLYGHEFYPVGHFFALAWLGAIVYSIRQHRILDLSFAPNVHVIQYARSFVFLLGVYVVIFFMIRLFTGTSQFLLAAVIVATFSLLANLLANLQKGVEKAVERALFRERHHAYETLSEFSKSLVTILDVRSLSEEIIRTLVSVIGIQTASLYLFNKESEAFVLACSQKVGADGAKVEKIGSREVLPHHLAYVQTILLREDLEQSPNGAHKAVLTTLRSLQSEACIPFVNKDRLIGFCSLGQRRAHTMYTQEEISLLTTLAQNAAIALDNAMLYEDLKRSQILMRRTDRLRSLETIAGGFAHEIRNPLTSIKTFVQLAPDRKDDPEFIGHFSKVVSEDVDRIERLIQEILDYARYMEPKFSQEDLNDIVSSCLYFIEVKADSKSVRIEKDLAPELPRIMLDRQQIKQVLLNLLLNAMDAMAELGGRLAIRTHRLTKASGQSWVQIEVADTGSGISAADLEHIFDPFYTTKHESGEREGTGLGLTIVHQIIQEHSGYIEVTSNVGSGTTFYVNLPVNPLPHQLSKEQEEHEKTSSIG